MKKINLNLKKTAISMEVDRQEFALALKTWRLRQGLTQQQVGDRFGVSRYSIMRAENQQPITWELAYRLFAKLSDALKDEA